jgi:hypothetical protein
MKSQTILDRLFAQAPTGSKNLRKLPIELDGVDIELWEQNPGTGSEFAARARQGERIAWGFVKSVYYCRISDSEGIVILTKERR